MSKKTITILIIIAAIVVLVAGGYGLYHVLNPDMAPGPFMPMK